MLFNAEACVPGPLIFVRVQVRILPAQVVFRGLTLMLEKFKYI
jgi:hypothetical protein